MADACPCSPTNTINKHFKAFSLAFITTSVSDLYVYDFSSSQSLRDLSSFDTSFYSRLTMIMQQERVILRDFCKTPCPLCNFFFFMKSICVIIRQKDEKIGDLSNQNYVAMLVLCRLKNTFNFTVIVSVSQPLQYYSGECNKRLRKRF